MTDFNDIGISRKLYWPCIQKQLSIGLFRPFCLQWAIFDLAAGDDEKE